MSEADKKRDQLELSSGRKALERYSLTGYFLPKWTTSARGKLTGLLGRLWKGGKEASIPAMDQTVGEKVEQTSVKAIKYVDARLDQIPVENQLKIAQTETEFAKAELLRQQARKTAVEAEGQELKNKQTYLDILKQIAELTEGRPPVRVLGPAGDEIVLVADVPAEQLESLLPSSSLAVLGFSTRVRNCLERDGIISVEMLTSKSDAEILGINGIGEEGLAEIKAGLAKRDIQCT